MIGFAMNVWSEFDLLASSALDLIFDGSTALRTMPIYQFSGLRVTNNDAVNNIGLTSNANLTSVVTVSGVSVTPTAGAVYQVGGTGTKLTVASASISGGSGTITFSGPGVPSAASGTLAKFSGTGDASISYSAYQSTGLWKVLTPFESLSDVDVVMGRGTIAQLQVVALSGSPSVHCELLQ
jgi:hypothetical protein